MRTTRLVSCAVLTLLCGSCARGGGLPKTVDSAPCQAVPTIDGVIGDDEWQGVPVLKFDMSTIRLDPVSTGTRACELRVMNTASTLYLALRVPDQTVDDSLTPPVLDVAMLAFCQGKQVRPGDDRKIVATGIYRDKHVGVPGKDDVDDAKQDGRAVMARKSGFSTIEWAVPLDSGDPDDLRAKPGDSVRFNLTYIDAFQLPITKATMCGVYGVQLDRSDAWGSIHLAPNARDLADSAALASSWVEPIFRRLAGTPAARLRLAEISVPPGASMPAARAVVSFTYLDPGGKPREARAKLYLPETVRAAGKKVPLYFNSGYELPDGMERDFLKRGWVVVSPRDLSTNPLIRTVNPDVALMHMVRALPFVDDTRVVVGGGSAGGYTTLLVAAETFPLGGAAPDVPPVNYGYNAAYFFKQVDLAGPRPGSGNGARLPVMFAVATMLKSSLDVFGDNYDDPVYHANSPVTHVPTITCPVSVQWSTADMLVPVNQVGSRWVQPFETSRFPEGFTMLPERLLKSREGRLTLMDALPASEAEVFTLKVPEGTSREGDASHRAPASRECPVSSDRPWSIVVIDEGPPEPGVGHRKYEFHLTHDRFFELATSGKIAPRQLTAAKLERLMDRYAGQEWLPSRLKHLDVPESERADVLRGLRTYTSSDPANARTFAELYTHLAPARRVLEPQVVKELTGASARH